MNLLMLQGSSELKKRMITGGLGALALILLIIFGGYVGVCLFVAVVSLGMIYEFSKMTFTSSNRVEKRYVLLMITWIVALVNVISPYSEFEILSTCFVLISGYYLFSSKKLDGEPFLIHFRELEYSLFGLLYLVFIPLFLTRIRMGSNGMHWVLVFLLIVWAGDTLAYFVGKKYGHHKLYPHVSPKKTVEGAVGGLLAGLLVTILYKVLFFPGMGWVSAVLVPLIIGAVSQVGDLCESYLKRVYGKKDSGSILPGHGGFLDRFDGVVFSVPVMYACTRFFG